MPYFDYRGECIEYVVIGQGQPLVLYHGLSSLGEWCECGYVAALQDAYRLILIKARDPGGDESPAPATPESLSWQCGIIMATLEHLQIGRAYLFGHQRGVSVVGNVAQEAPERVRALISSGTALGPSLQGILTDRGIPCLLNQTTQALQDATFRDSVRAFLDGVWHQEREELKQQMSALITALAEQCHRRLGGQQSDPQDLEQIGWEILLGEVIRRYHPGKGSLSAYAAIRIRGAMIDYIRRYGSLISVRRLPGVQRQQLEELKRLRQHWQAEHGWEPTSAELADHLGMPPENVEQLLDLEKTREGIRVVLAEDTLDDYHRRDPHHVQRTPEDDAAETELAELATHCLAPCLAQLPAELCHVVRLRMQGMSLRAVGLAVGIKHPQAVQDQEQHALGQLRRCFEQCAAGRHQHL